MNEKFVLIGAGSATFTRGLLADLITRKWSLEVALVDINPESLEIVERLAKKMVTQARRPNIAISAFTDRREALRGATSVICTIAVGGRRSWEQDIFTCRSHDIYMPVGDTVGPGGSSRALRMIPAMIDIAKDVMDICPEALFFNYSNPMTAVCRGVRKATGANIVGLCHGVSHVARYLAEALDISTEKLAYTSVGMNHLTWFVDIKYQDCNGNWTDAFPKLKMKADKNITVSDDSTLASHFSEAGNAPTSPEDSFRDNPFSWHLFNIFNAFPAALDRHVCEFFPHLFPHGSYYGKRLGIDAYSFENTIAYGDKRFVEMAEAAHSVDPLPDSYFHIRKGEHEQVMDIVEDIRANRPGIYSVNLPNKGQLSNFPDEVIVEAPAITTEEGFRPLLQRPLPAALAGTLASRFQWVETIVEAAIQSSKEKFIRALIIDGYVSSLERAKRLADDLITAQAAYVQ